MNIALLAVPYDSALRDTRAGAGPARLLDSGLERDLRDQGHRVSLASVDLAAGGAQAEIRSAFELARSLATRVATARAEGELPIVLAGNCNSALGTVAGLGDDTAVCWFDAHGDFNTPETTVGGFLDGMALATLTGRCWTQLSGSIPGFTRVREDSVILIGARDLDPLEERLLSASNITRLTARSAVATLPEALDALPATSRGVYVHVDLDVLDPSEGKVNMFAATDGIPLDDLLSLLRAIGERRKIAGAAITAFDPGYDTDGRINRAGKRIILEIARLADAPPGAIAGESRTSL